MPGLISINRGAYHLKNKAGLPVCRAAIKTGSEIIEKTIDEFPFVKVCNNCLNQPVRGRVKATFIPADVFKHRLNFEDRA